jgi:hypothetical protein
MFTDFSLLSVSWRFYSRCNIRLAGWRYRPSVAHNCNNTIFRIVWAIYYNIIQVHFTSFPKDTLLSCRGETTIKVDHSLHDYFYITLSTKLIINNLFIMNYRIKHSIDGNIIEH